MATICTGPFWKNHSQDGRIYRIEHLQPKFVNLVIPAVAATKKKPGRAEMRVVLRILYSHHCFTQALEKVPMALPEHYYTCTKRPNDKRVFCATRWNESLALPDIVAGMKNCYFTRHDNYFVWRNPVDPKLGEYFVYFGVSNRSRFIELEIESAYPRDDADEAKAGAMKVSINTLIVNAANGRATHRPPSV